VKVYGGTVEGQYRCIVAAPDWTAAHAAVNAVRPISRKAMRDYWSITGNEKEIAAAVKQPGKVLKRDRPSVEFEVWK
jgi:hypothetical protein